METLDQLDLDLQKQQQQAALLTSQAASTNKKLLIGGAVLIGLTLLVTLFLHERKIHRK